ncbi:MAG: hypothetical protein JNK60_05690, partial [Acidobacteria bacterium]|nr:hypothetical protein [Acidobacteriota bacterium]
MAVTKVFRDRVVSLEQTFELGEKYLPLLDELFAEALPGFRRTEHDRAHEEDLFVVTLADAAGATRKISLSRMVMSDPSCLPALHDTPRHPVRDRIVERLREQAERPLLALAFRDVMNEEDRSFVEEVDAEWRKLEEERAARKKIEDERRERERRERKKQEEARQRNQREQKEKERLAREKAHKERAEKRRAEGAPAGERRGPRPAAPPAGAGATA